MTVKPKVLEWIEEAETVAITIPEEAPKRMYDEKLVAWFDILGMRRKIYESNDAEEVLTIMGNLQRYVENSCEDLVAKELLDYLQISDGFIIIAELGCINELCDILCQIQWQVLVFLQMLLRGAITAGKISMTDDTRLIIGPAFIEAFALESENAIYPRVLIADEIYKYIDKEKFSFKYIKEDSDNFKYLDFLRYIIEKEKYEPKNLSHFLQTQGVKSFLKEGYEKNIRNKKDIAQKHGWLISKLAENNVSVL